MWCRQHKMYVGKWHLKTLLLCATLVLAVVLYVRFQDELDLGSRQLREGFEVHAYGAKPYKSLAYTRNSMAEMRNKTLSTHRSKKRKGKKGGPESLSVGQLPSRRSKSRDDERRSSRGRSRDGSRASRGRGRLHQSKRISSKNRPSSMRSSPERPKAAEKILKNETLPANRNQGGQGSLISKTADFSLPPTAQTPLNIVNDSLKLPALSPLAQGGAANFNQGSQLPGQPKNFVADGKIDSDMKKQKDVSGGDDRSKSDKGEKESRDKERDSGDEKDRKDRSDRRSRSDEEKSLLFRGESRGSRNNDRDSSKKDRQDKRSRSRSDEKDDDRHRDADKSREDRNRGSSRRSESRKKPAEIKLIDDRLDSVTSQNKAGVKESTGSNSTTTLSTVNGSDATKTASAGLLNQTPLQDPILGGNMFRLRGQGGSDSSFSSVTGLFSSSNDTNSGAQSSSNNGNESETLTGMQVVPRVGSDGKFDSNSSHTDEDSEAADIWHAIQNVLKSQGSLETDLPSSDSASEPPKAVYTDLPTIDAAKSIGRPAVPAPLVAGAGPSDGFGRDFDGNYYNGGPGSYPRTYQDEYRLTPRERAFARLLEEEKQGSSNYYHAPSFGDVYPRVVQYPASAPPGNGYHRQGAFIHPTGNDVLVDGHRVEYIPQDGSVVHYNRLPANELGGPAPPGDMFPSQLQVDEIPKTKVKDFSIDEDENGEEEDEEDDVTSIMGGTGTVPGADTARLTPNKAQATSYTGLSPQELVRARMASYAATSARNDPGPTEIKPVSRLSKAQQVHSIPQ